MKFFFKFSVFSKKNHTYTYSNIFINCFFFKSFFLENALMIKSTYLVKCTNYTPVVFLHSWVKLFIFKKFKKDFTPNFYKFIYYYFGSFFEKISNRRVFFKILGNINNSLATNNVLEFIFSKNRSLQLKVGRGFFLLEMLEVLYFTFKFKDLTFLMKWFVKTMYRVSFKNHKKLLSVFKQIVINYSDILVHNNNVSGFFFDIRGKVGVTGDAKKRSFFFNVGKYSKTTKNSKFNYQFNTVRTDTGALGITMVLYYN